MEAGEHRDHVPLQNSIDIREIIFYNFIDQLFNQSKQEITMSPRGKKLNEQMRTEAMAKIIRAALEVFAEHGYHGTTMEQIMRVSGLSKGLVYHYFPSKEKMFFHLIDAALGISRNIWKDALDSPGTAWEKIEKLSEHLVKIAFTDESLLYSRIILQGITQGKGIPGLLEYIFQHATHFNLLPPLITEAQKSGEAAQGDPEVLASTYFALYQGYMLLLLHDDELKKKITPEIFTTVLRNTGKAG
jgi:AcrR family transcriptional regulator